jgi:FkbM family methyltransferase
VKEVATDDGPIWLPDDDTHFAALGRHLAAYQEEIYNTALTHCRKQRVAFDIGAHVGLFSRRMLRDFDRVFAFEPAGANLECLQRNAAAANVIPFAIGETFGSVTMNNPAAANSGAWEATFNGDTPLRPLDALFQGGGIDLIKMDCQGFELAALLGGIQLILSNRPVLLIETYMKGTRDGRVEAFLTNHGYKRVARVNKDDVFVWSGS